LKFQLAEETPGSGAQTPFVPRLEHMHVPNGEGKPPDRAR
jgi:hypothetical protein